MKKIAVIYNDYISKFGIPRQSGIVEEESIIIFEPEYRVPESLRGLDEFNYIWLIWGFSENEDKEWTPTVRPPRLGGNKRVGVFATRSPFRPNSLGLSSVKLLEIKDYAENGKALIVSGADLMNGTPIYDIKPYLKYADSHVDATDGFALTETGEVLKVNFDDDLLKVIPEKIHKPLIEILSQDPRPQYIDDEDRIYGLSYGGYNIKFSVNDSVLTVVSVTCL